MRSPELPSNLWEEFEAGLGKGEKDKIQFSMVEHLVFPFEKSSWSKLAPGWTVVEGDRKRILRLPMKISHLEKIIPFLLEKEGFITRVNKEVPSNSIEQRKPALLGNTIHELNSLFHVVVQGYGAVNIHKVMPTLTNTDAEKRKDRYQAICDGLYVKNEAYRDYLNLFVEIIKRRRTYGGLVPDGMDSLINLVPGRNIAAEETYVYDDESLKRAEWNFAKFFARELVSAMPIIWAFMRNTKVTSEAVEILNFKKDYPIQLKGAIDLIMRRQDRQGKYIAWLGDLKTGKEGVSENPLERGIVHFQNQLYALMGSAFTTNDALMNQEWINPPRVKNNNGKNDKDADGAFIFSLNPERIDMGERIHKISILRFDSMTGRVKLEDVPLPTKDPAFLPRLNWLAKGITMYREELWKLINSDINYDLNRVKYSGR